MMLVPLPLGLVMGLTLFAGFLAGGAAEEPIVIAATDRAISFQAPARVCIFAEVKSDLSKLLGNRQDVELRSLKEGSSAVTSQVEQVVAESLTTAQLPLHDSNGGRIIRTYGSGSQARSGCANSQNATYANVIVSANSSGRPYRITTSISQNGTTIEQHFERDAISELDELLKKHGPYVESQGTIPLRLGVGWSVDGDIRITMRRLLAKVTWRGIYD
jgi:hypothetical protein